MGFLDRFRVKAKQAEPQKDFYVPSDAEGTVGRRHP